MATTLITGASGFIGSHVLRALVVRGDAVRATRRPGSRSEIPQIGGVEVVAADILDRRAIRRAMRGVERVFHVAGTAELGLSRAATFSVILEGSRIVLEEALRADVHRIVLTSSAAAIGPAARGQVADETSPWPGGRLGIPHADAKHEAELVAAGLVARGLPLVIVNPACVLGAGDPGRSSTAFVLAFLRRRIPAYVDGTLNIVGVQDVARGHLLADERGRLGERYILGNRNFTMTRLLADLGRLSGVAPPALRLPAPVGLALAQTGGPLGLDLPLPVQVRAAAMNWSFSNRRARGELGWVPSPHEDCLEETIAYYRRRGGPRLADPGSGQPLALRLAAASLRRLGL
jgi:dihydroflavonol-4-reductase